jgi:hypothetical protein
MGMLTRASDLGIPSRPGADSAVGRKPVRRRPARGPSVLLEALPETPPATRPEPTHEQISLRAYELYLARDGAPGSPEDDWHRAERQLREGKA